MQQPTDKKIALLVSSAAALQIAEWLIPFPIPGIKPGLANIMTLIALVDMGPRVAIQIAVLRTLVASIFLGSFLSPTFILSFSGSVASSLVMVLLFELFKTSEKPLLSLVGISILGAFTNNLVQMSIVSSLLVKNSGVFLLMPWLGTSAVITGWITGVLACKACCLLEQPSGAETRQYAYSFTINDDDAKKENGNRSWPSPFVKILIVLCANIAVLIWNNYIFYAITLSFLLGLSIFFRIRIGQLLSSMARLSMFILSFFLIAVFLNRNGNVVVPLGPLSITDQGLVSGVMYVWRLSLVWLSAFLLTKTTTIEELSNGIRTLLWPMKLFRMSPDRTASIISISLSHIPLLLKNFYGWAAIIKEQATTFKNLFPALSGFMVFLYRSVDQKGVSVNN
jgi:heptaprenyl diphosphate synthase